ncbi:hypothetical protein [uncultured Thiothrix sp.]|uniref:hypothetical protein n=1 Tax=uncultured Thiothrix sp. TaxID=223185 RepID=UPI002629306F|nr:hypothetical protein [uncultured Thiothrix sp.]HMT92407.1 hypothetical protein [Thiolinea sp.]
MSGNPILDKDVNNLSTPLPQAQVFEGGRFLLEQGIKGDLAKLEQVAQNFDNDPLTLRLLSTYLRRWYAGRLNGLESIPILFDQRPTGRALRRLLAAFEMKLAGASDMSLLYLVSLSDQPVPQLPMKLIFRSTFVERWLSRRDDYVRFLAPLGRLNEDHWHWVVENLRRLNLLEQPIAGHHDLLLVPERIRLYLREELRLKNPVAYKQGCIDLEKLFRENIVPLVTLEAVVEEKPKPILWEMNELDVAQQQVLALRCSLAALRQHSHEVHQHLLSMHTVNLITATQENNPTLA